MFGPGTCGLGGPLKACVALLASLPTTDGPHRSGLRKRIHTVFPNPACSWTQNSCAAGKTQGRNKEGSSTLLGRKLLPAVCGQHGGPPVRSSLSLRARPSACTAAVSLPRTRGSLLLLNCARAHLQGRYPDTMPGTFPSMQTLVITPILMAEEKSHYLVFTKWRKYIDFYFYEAGGFFF